MKATPMMFSAVLALGTVAWAQNDATNASPAATQTSSPSSDQDSSAINSQGNIDRSGIKKPNSRRTAANAYADCGDYNVRSAAGSPPGSTDSNSASGKKTAEQKQLEHKTGSTRPDCPQKQ